jgi:predicted helicase
MACGTGKTLVSAWAAQRMGARRIVFLAPSIHVTQQAADEWASVGIPATVIVASERKEGALVTTDPAAIAEALHERAEWAAFATYDSAAKLGAALRALGVVADLLVCDEAHRIAGPDGKKWAAALDDEAIPAARRLFFTATPRVNTRDLEGVIGMDDEEIFGPVVHRLTFGDAIERGLIADYVVKCAEVPDSVDTTQPGAV